MNGAVDRRKLHLDTCEPSDRRAYDLLSGSFETYPQENGGIKLYGVDDNARVTSYLYKNGVTVGEMVNRRISLEEYYTRTITAKEAV